MSTPVRISFDASNIEDCRRVLAGLQRLFATCHGAAAARSLFVSHTKSRRETQKEINFRLLCDQMKSGLSDKKFAKKVAEKNNSSAEAIEKQLRRERKRLKKSGVYHRLATRDNS